ncbi:hypothetical protein QCA50_001714 [Cerrena zonata]|uniref:DUF7726 domain-containing protein n=1 Tax=Cerrena zonata TaxID=2478898 RepID=A0AAW0GLR9_9APHY
MPKRKSDVIDLSEDAEEPEVTVAVSKPQKKKARVSNASQPSDDEGSHESEPSSSRAAAKPKHWSDITLKGDDEGDVPVYDDCNEVRRKIRLLQKTPGFKTTHWLAEIGGINSNSFGRFMKLSGPNQGASNGTYYAAYVYFEKKRILEGKPKTKKRLQNERERPFGFPLEQRGMWVRSR